jgi:hypothetical protein
MYCRHATVSSFVTKFRGEVFFAFWRSRLKTSQLYTELAVWPASDPLDDKENDEYALDFALRLSHLFRCL